MDDDAIPHEVEESNRGALELVLRDDALADTVHEAEVPVDCLCAPLADLLAGLEGRRGSSTYVVESKGDLLQRCFTWHVFLAKKKGLKGRDLPCSLHQVC